MNKKNILKVALLLVFSFAYADKYENIGKLYYEISVDNNRASASCIEKYGEPDRTEIKYAKEFYPHLLETDIYLYYFYENMEFIFFVGNIDKDFTIFWQITGDFSVHSPLLEKDMSMDDVISTFGTYLMTKEENSIEYLINDGKILFEFRDNKLMRVRAYV